MSVPRGTSQKSAGSSQNVTDRDYATWLPKVQAAEAIGVSTKTVEKLAQAGQLQQASWRRPSGGPAVVVYHPADVARLAQERRPGASAFVLPAGADFPRAPRNGNGAGALARTVSIETPAAPGDDPLRLVFAAALRAVTSETSQKPPTLWLTLEEAAAVAGLSATYLRRQIAAGKLEAVRDRGWRVRRRDLEAL